MENGPGLKTYFLLKIGEIFQPAMLVYLRVITLKLKSLSLKIGWDPKGNWYSNIFQPSIFRGELLVFNGVYQIHTLKPNSEGSPLKIGKTYFTSFASSREGMR